MPNWLNLSNLWRIIATVSNTLLAVPSKPPERCGFHVKALLALQQAAKADSERSLKDKEQASHYRETETFRAQFWADLGIWS